MNINQLDREISESASSLSAAYLNSVRAGIEQHYQMDLGELLQQVDLTDEQLADPQYMVPFFKVGALFMLLLQKTGDGGLGLVVGSLVQPRSYQVLGYAIMSCSNLKQAIDRLLRYEKLVGKLGSTELTIEDGVCRLRWQCPFDGPWSGFVKESAIAGWVTYGRQLLPEGVQLKQVCFEHDALVAEDRYRSLFQCSVSFAQSWSGVEFDAGLLDAPLLSADPGLQAMMDSQAEVQLKEFESKANLHNEVRAELIRLLPGGEPTLEAVAMGLNVSPRLLQSRLRDGGMPYKEFLESVRKSLALSLLEDESLSLLDIAFLLGFAEQSSFSRAFKRWNGLAPQAFRKQQFGL